MYIMKRYTISQARERLADVLDEAERNGAVVIERRDVQYVIRATHTAPRKACATIGHRDARPRCGGRTVAVELDCQGYPLRAPRPALVILLDTNALIWLEQGHARTRALAATGKRLYISPVSLLELQFLLESGRIRLRRGGVSDLVTRGPWLLDDPPATAWFDAALDSSAGPGTRSTVCSSRTPSSAAGGSRPETPLCSSVYRSARASKSNRLPSVLTAWFAT